LGTFVALASLSRVRYLACYGWAYFLSVVLVMFVAIVSLSRVRYLACYGWAYFLSVVLVMFVALASLAHCCLFCVLFFFTHPTHPRFISWLAFLCSPLARIHLSSRLARCASAGSVISEKYVTCKECKSRVARFTRYLDDKERSNAIKGIHFIHALIALAYGFAYGATILAHCLDFSV
jgi:hypothetical protein